MKAIGRLQSNETRNRSSFKYLYLLCLAYNNNFLQFFALYGEKINCNCCEAVLSIILIFIIFKMNCRYLNRLDRCTFIN